MASDFRKTIEERAKEVGMLSQVRSDYPYDKRSVEFGYTQGATEQKAIDEANYKQGYHDAIERACEWFKDYLNTEMPDIDDWLLRSPNIDSGEEMFRKSMEEYL